MRSSFELPPDVELVTIRAIVAYHVNAEKVKVNKVVQIPYSGNPLATSVAERLRVPLVPGRKGKAIPGSWNPRSLSKKRFSLSQQERLPRLRSMDLKRGTIYILSMTSLPTDIRHALSLTNWKNGELMWKVWLFILPNFSNQG